MASIEPREQVISVGGTKVYTLIGGRGDPLVVLHGAGGPRGWRRWMAALSEQFTIYAPTHPGFGGSDGAEWMEDIGDLARFYLWFLDSARLEAQESRMDHATTMRSIELMGAKVIPAIRDL